jgi:hypothetical protein
VGGGGGGGGVEGGRDMNGFDDDWKKGRREHPVPFTLAGRGQRTSMSTNNATQPNDMATASRPARHSKWCPRCSLSSLDDCFASSARYAWEDGRRINWLLFLFMPFLSFQRPCSKHLGLV